MEESIMDELLKDYQKTDINKAIEAIQPKPVSLKFPKDEKLYLYEIFDEWC